MKTEEIILRDSGVLYDPIPHTYSYQGRVLSGITKTLINRAFPKSETYGKVPESVLNHAAERGAACHQAVGNMYEIGIASTGYETIAERSKKLLESVGLTPIRFEYVVTDYDRYASPIDIVCLNEENEICIVDMKFTSKLLRESVTLQTTIYKKFFHIVNPDLEAKHLYALWVHTNDSHEILDSGIYKLTPMDDEFIDNLIAADKSDTPIVYDMTGTLPSAVADIEDYVAKLSQQVKQGSEELNSIKAGLCKLMQDNNVKQYESRKLKLTMMYPKPRTTFDIARFKEEHADLYSEYVEVTMVSPTVRITVKES